MRVSRDLAVDRKVRVGAAPRRPRRSSASRFGRILQPDQVTTIAGALYSSGFLALVDPDAYDGFVGSDCTWDNLRDDLVREAREQHLLVWSTGMEHVWSIDVLFQTN